MSATQALGIHGTRVSRPAKKHPRQQVHRCQASRSVPSVAPSINPANAVVVLAAVLGSRNAAMSATQALGIHGTRVSRPAKKHPRQQVHRCQASRSAPSAAPSINPANAVVALAAVLGSRNAAMSATQALAIHGT